jgi:hypothetical protein
MSHVDADGHCPFCIGAAIGGALGAAIVVGAEVYNGVPVFTKESGKRILGGAVGGAITGGTFGEASEAGLPLILEAVAGGSGAVAGGIADQ